MPEIEPDKPASSWKLGETGRRRSELLADRLRGFSPQVVWSSAEPKAVETAEIVAKTLDVPACAAGGLAEHARASTPFFATRNEFEQAVERFFREPDRLVLGEETAEYALARFAAVINKIISAGHADNVVVTHGTVMTLYVASVAGVRHMSFWRMLEAPSYIVLSLPDYYIRSIFCGVTAEKATGRDIES